LRGMTEHVLSKVYCEKGDYLNIGAWQERSVVNGPGERFVLWLQGCPLRCHGCVNSEFLPFVKRKLISVDEMAQRILVINGIEGVTYTGGEPMAQARGLALLSEKLRPRGLMIVCYTGYTLESLRARNDPWVKRLLSHVDMLIDGPYVQEKAANLLWRGSSNQRIHFLTDAYRHLAEQVDHRQAEIEFTIGSDGFITTGTWPQELLKRLEEKLRR